MWKLFVVLASVGATGCDLFFPLNDDDGQTPPLVDAPFDGEVPAIALATSSDDVIAGRPTEVVVTATGRPSSPVFLSLAADAGTLALDTAELVIDAAGRGEVLVEWVPSTYANASVTVDGSYQASLMPATRNTLPVRVKEVLGNVDQQDTNGVPVANTLIAIPIDLLHGPAEILDVGIELTQVGGTGTGVALFGIYSDSAGPANLLVTSTQFKVSTETMTFGQPMPPMALAPGRYWLAFIASESVVVRGGLGGTSVSALVGSVSLPAVSPAANQTSARYAITAIVAPVI